MCLLQAQYIFKQLSVEVPTQFKIALAVWNDEIKLQVFSNKNTLFYSDTNDEKH